MSDNAIINASMQANYDWMLILIVVSIVIVSILSHLARRRWVMQGGRRVCGSCLKQYVSKAKELKASLGEIVRTPAQDDIYCMDCHRGIK